LTYISDVLPRTLVAAFSIVFVTSAPQTPLVVSAAISLTDALTDIARVFRESGGEHIRYNFAGSNVLARQILNGAPADLFISADDAQMRLAAATGAVERPIPLLRNRLAVVTPAGKAATVPDVTALAKARRVAVGDPSAVPAGVYAREYLMRTGDWQALEPRLLPLANVRAALNAVEAGGADAGIVYESDAAASRRVDLAFVIDGPQAPQIIYPAAVVTASRNKAGAERFLAFLRGPQAGEVFAKYKFRQVPGSSAQRPTPSSQMPAPNSQMPTPKAPTPNQS
jgi:molybdate transport system substrate-binding protein